MSLKNIVKAIPLSIFDSADLTGDFQPINTNGLPAACFLIRVNNDSTVGVILSFDGVNDNEFLSAGEVMQLEFQTNKGPINQSAYLAQGTTIYIKEETDAGTGDIYLSGYYQPTS